MTRWIDEIQARTERNEHNRDDVRALLGYARELELKNERLDAEAESYANQAGLLEQENKRRENALREIASPPPNSFRDPAEIARDALISLTTTTGYIPGKDER